MLFLYLQRPRWQGSQQIFERKNFFTSATRQHIRANSVSVLFTRVRTDFCQRQQWIFFVKASRLLPRKLCNALFRWLLESAYKWNRTGKNFNLIRPKKNLHTLPFKKLQGCARPVKTKGGSVQVFVRSKMCPDLLSGVVLTLWTRARSRFAVLKLSFVLLPIMLFFPS